MARNLLKRYNNVEEYNRVKCTLDIRQISLINTYKETKYGPENYTITSVYKVRNKSNNIKLFNNTTLVNSMNRMYINGIEVEPTNEFQFDDYENATIECEFCDITEIPDKAFSGCTFLTSIELPNSVKSIGNSAFKYCYGLTSLVIGSGVTSIGEYAFSYCYWLTNINFKSKYPPNTHVSAFDSINNREIKIPYNNFYKTWWHNNKISGTPIYPFTEKQYHDLNITSVGRVDDGKQTTVQVRYSCLFDGYDISNTYHTNIKEEGVLTSSEFPQNTSESSSVERKITIEYQGLTASTTITQGPMKPLPPKNYSVELNNQWELSTTITNPDNSIYDGVYQSYSNKGVNNSAAVMYIDIENYENFKIYIRSYAESNYDYVMVSQLDTTITSDSSYSDTTLVKAHTRGKQSSTTSISGYTLVEFTEIPEGKHRITVLYRKDSSASSGDDRGYVLIPKEQ